jgi:hypothetical protein
MSQPILSCVLTKTLKVLKFVYPKGTRAAVVRKDKDKALLLFLDGQSWFVDPKNITNYMLN